MTNEPNRYKDIGARIREARDRAGLSQQELAESVGFESGTAISLIEKGLRKVSIPHLDKIAAALHLTTIQLLGEDTAVPSTDPISSLRYALRADKEIDAEDEARVLDFYSYVKNQKSNA